MAPREASGTFPDQYLTFDFEPSVGLGAPPVHEPFPAVTDQLNLEDGGNNAANEGGDEAGNGSNVRTSNTASQVDPLSIDPTANGAVDTRPSMQMPDLSMGHHSMQTTLRNVNTHTASTMMPHQSGSPPLPRTAVVVSPQSSVDAGVPAVASDLTAGSSSSSPGVALPPSRSLFSAALPPRPVSVRSVRSVRSVLDHAASMESEDDDEVPGLDVTYDSNVSMMNQSNSWEAEQSHVVEDDQSAASPAAISSADSTTSSASSVRTIQQTAAFDMSSDEPGSPTLVAPIPTPTSPNSLSFSFGPNTTVSDLK
jgi:hypothetical protein